MTSEKRDHQELLNDIIEIELNMFQQVKTVETSLCQERPEAFKIMRGMTHSVLSAETLKSYLEDLRKAKAEGKNLVTGKYARMQNLIPPLKFDPTIKNIIENIVKTENYWMKEISAKYPCCLMGQIGNFEVYLRGELETYSDETLRLYFADIAKAEREGRNLAKERYDKLAKNLGYDSIDSMEKTIAQQNR